MKKTVFFILVLMTAASLFADEGVNRHNVTDDMANPKRVKADDLFYAKLGYGANFAGLKDSGTSFGFGYRNEMDDLAVDFGFLNWTIGQNNTDADYDYSANVVQIQGLYFFSPVDNSTFYAGAGLAYNVMHSVDDKNNYFSSGVGGVATLGYEIMRASTVRLFFQLEATVPFGKLKNHDTKEDSRFGSSVAFTMGIGF